MCRVAQFIVKYVLFFANFVFSLAGLALVGIGIAGLVQLGDLSDIIPAIVSAIPIAIIVLGAVIFAIAFFGCCGAIRESKCLLVMYFICMGILAAGKIYLTVVIFRGLNNIQTTVAGWVNDAFNPGEPTTVPQSFDVLQIAFECCGTTGPSAYGQFALPASCCPITNVQQATCSLDDAYSDGCVSTLTGYFESFGDAIGAVLITIIVVELVAMLFGMFLCSSLTRKR